MKRHIHSIIFLLIFAVDVLFYLAQYIYAVKEGVTVDFPLANPLTALLFSYPLLPLIALTFAIERITGGKKIVRTRKILTVYFALDILCGILGFWLYDNYLFSLFVPFYSRFAFVVNASSVGYIFRYGYLPEFDILLRLVYYIAYYLNFALLLRSLSRRITQGEQVGEMQ